MSLLHCPTINPSGSANGYPINDPVSAAFAREVGGFPAGVNPTKIRPWCYWHRVTVPVAGTQQYTFFNVARTQNITNLENAGTLPANYALAVHTMRFKFLYGFNANGTRISAATPLATTLNLGASSAAVADQLARIWQISEKTRELIEQGVVTLWIGDNKIIEYFGLDNFPSGRGANAQYGVGASAANGAAAASVGDAVGNQYNGAPVLCNAFPFGTPFPIMPGQQFRVQVDYTTLVDWAVATLGPLNGVGDATAAGMLQCDLIGNLYSPGSA